MLNPRWLLALPLALAVTIGSAHASSINDRAGLFDRDAVREAEAKLSQIERQTGLTTTIETIDSLEGREIIPVAEEHAARTRTEGLFILISKKDHRIEVVASRPFWKAFPPRRRLAIRDTFVNAFKAGDYNAGLRDGAEAIVREVEAARSELGGQLRESRGRTAIAPGRPVVRRQNSSGFGLGSLLGIGLLILAVLVGVRLLGSLFGGRAGSQYGAGMGRPGYGPGPGPGYGGGGYGGGGGGFMSSLFGGIGGAMAGNWLYDQFPGRHNQGGSYVDNSAYVPPGDAVPADDPANDWVGGSSEAGDWGGGGDGGGDWGGGGGGGDWGNYTKIEEYE